MGRIWPHPHQPWWICSDDRLWGLLVNFTWPPHPRQWKGASGIFDWSSGGPRMTPPFSAHFAGGAFRTRLKPKAWFSISSVPAACGKIQRFLDLERSMGGPEMVGRCSPVRSRLWVIKWFRNPRRLLSSMADNPSTAQITARSRWCD